MCLWVKPFFIAGPFVTSKGLRGRKKFSTVLVQMNFVKFNGSFYEPKLSAQWCREGGCSKCQPEN